MTKLSVNIDHIATVRQARREPWPDPVLAARLAEAAGASGITAHLREDRRHIQDLDVRRLRRSVRGKFNLEMAAQPSMLRLAMSIGPDEATFVPEKRQELTTEGGLDVARQRGVIASATKRLTKAGIVISHFIDPQPRQIVAARECGAAYVEFHTGAYAHAFLLGHRAKVARALLELRQACQLAHALGLGVNLGHGLTYWNVGPIAKMPHAQDLNIGHNIVARACLYGMRVATRQMLAAMRGKKITR